MTLAAAAAGAALSAAAGPGGAPVLLNHFYVQVDRATFDAAAQSPFLREQFGALEKRTTVRADTTYTGIYIYGEHTYLELLSPDSSFGAPAGIAFGVEQAGAIEKICAALQNEVKAAASVDPVTRAPPGGGETPWFKACSTQAQLSKSGLRDWIMEYEPVFFARFHPELPPKGPGITRADALTRYAAACGQGRQRSEGLFEDVTALELVLAREDAPLFAARCRAFGLALSESRDALACRGSGFELRASFVDGAAQRAPARAGIAAAHLKLRRDGRKSTQQLGSTTLTIDGKTAVWRF